MNLLHLRSPHQFRSRPGNTNLRQKGFSEPCRYNPASSKNRDSGDVIRINALYRPDMTGVQLSTMPHEGFGKSGETAQSVKTLVTLSPYIGVSSARFMKSQNGFPRDKPLPLAIPEDGGH